MKIVIFSTIEPFIQGGAKKQFQILYTILKEKYPNTDLYFIPSNYELKEIFKQIIAIRQLSIHCDLIITSRPLSYAIKHPNKILWFMHHIPYFYEFSNTKLNPYLKYLDFDNIKKEFIRLDTFLITESKKIFAVSNFVKNKLKNYNKIESQILYPALKDTDKFYHQSYQDYFFLPSYITYTKRQHLIIESLLYTQNPVKLILAGQIDKKYLKKYIKPLLKYSKIKQNLKIIDKFIEPEKYSYYANCLGVIFTPINEAFGYVTIESFLSRKPVITTIDSGGPQELVINNYNGIVTTPNPKEIATILDTLYENRKLTENLGKNAYQFALENFNYQKLKNTIFKNLLD